MKKIILPLIAILLFAISIYTVVDYNKSKSRDLGVTIKESSKIASTIIGSDSYKIAAIDFKLTDLSGKDVSLSDFKGKKIFLNFWASWCPPCKAEMPDIEKLYGQTKDSDLIILAVNIGEDSKTVKSFIDNNKYNFTILLDSNQSIAAEYNITAIPTSFFIDKEGNIISTIKGGMSFEQMQEHISKL